MQQLYQVVGDLQIPENLQVQNNNVDMNVLDNNDIQEVADIISVSDDSDTLDISSDALPDVNINADNNFNVSNEEDEENIVNEENAVDEENIVNEENVDDEENAANEPMEIVNNPVINPIQIMCLICMDAEIEWEFQPCGHRVACPQCAIRITHGQVQPGTQRICSLCREPIRVN